MGHDCIGSIEDYNKTVLESVKADIAVLTNVHMSTRMYLNAADDD